MQRSILNCLLSCLLMLGAHNSTAITQIVTVGGSSNSFSPAFFTINPGDTVKWVWGAGFHNTASVTVPTGAAAWYANIVNSGSSFMYVPTVSGLYKYDCTFHAGMDGQFFVTGCSFPAKPDINITSQANVCAGDTIILRTIPQAGVSYKWYCGFALLSATADSAVATLSGSYRLVVNRCGVDSVSNVLNLNFHALPAPSFTYTRAGLSYTCTNTTISANPCSYEWDFGDGSASSTGFHAVHTYTSSGSYLIKLKARDSLTGCTDSVSLNINAQLNIESASAGKATVMPNPAGSLLTINVSTLRAAFMISSAGQCLPLALSGGNGKYAADISNLGPGYYLLILETAEGRQYLNISIVR